MRFAQRLLVDKLVTLEHLRPKGKEIVLVLGVWGAFAPIQPLNLVYGRRRAFTNLLVCNRTRNGTYELFSFPGRREEEYNKPNFVPQSPGRKPLEVLVDNPIDMTAHNLLNLLKAFHSQWTPLTDGLDDEILFNREGVVSW